MADSIEQDPFDAVTETGLENLEARTAKKGVTLIRIVYAVFIGVAAIWVYRKLFKK